jgi:hypothetical protein
MILRRLSQSLKEQNWTAIVIEFVLLVSGVFLGIQVANWNAERVDAFRAIAYLERIRDDINADLSNYQDRISFWSDVSSYGAKGLAYAETGDAKGATQWDLLLAYFQASQVAEFYTTDATFEELKSAGELGLIKDTRFRYELSQYYSLGFNPLLTERPRYREHVRGIIPLEIQTYIWTACYSTSTLSVQKMLPCKSPLDEKAAAVIVDSIRNDKTLMAELRYWMSGMHVAALFANARIERATAVRASIDAKLGGSPKNDAP